MNKQQALEWRYWETTARGACLLQILICTEEKSYASIDKREEREMKQRQKAEQTVRQESCSTMKSNHSMNSKC